MTYADYMEMWATKYANGETDSREVPLTETEWNKKYKGKTQ